MSSGPSMSAVEIARESILNVVSRWWTSALLVALAMFAGFVSVWSAYGDGHAVSEQLHVYERYGAYSFVVAGVHDDQRLSAIACEQLFVIDGINAAGGLVTESIGEVDLGDRFSVNIAIGTPGLAGFLWPESRPKASVVVGADIADRAGLVPSAALVVTLDATPVLVAVDEVSDVTVREDRYNRTLFIAAALTEDSEVARCFVDVSPKHMRAAQQLVLDWFDGEVRVIPFFIPDGASSEPQVLLDNRTSKWIPAVAMIAVWAVLMLAWSGRRNDYALYRILGLSRAGLVLMLTIESAVLAFIPILAGVIAALTLIDLPLNQLELSLVVIALAQLSIASFVVPAVGYLITGMQNPLRVLSNSI